jgi:hypothetical protein
MLRFLTLDLVRVRQSRITGAAPVNDNNEARSCPSAANRSRPETEWLGRDQHGRNCG